MTEKNTIFTVTITIALIFLVSCSGTIEHETQPEEIKIGSILILTGEGASWGTASQNGIDMAIEEINSQGGVNGKLLRANHENDKSDPKAALTAFRKLTEVDEIDFIIGTTWSHTGLPLVDLAYQNQVVMISPSLGVSEFNEGSEFLFNTWPHDFILSQQLADVVFEEGHRSVAVFGTQNVWVQDQTNAFTERFEELGGSVDLLLEPTTDDTNLRPEALKVRESNVDAVVMTNGVMNVGPISAQRMQELGIGIPLFSMTLDANIIKAAEGAFDGMTFLTFLTPTEEFEQAYKAKFNMEVEIGAASAFDAVMMLAEAMEETGSEDPVVIKQFLNGIENFDGMSGQLISDGQGGFTKEFVAMEVQNGVAITATS